MVKEFSLASIKEGDKHQFEYQIRSHVYEGFVGSFADVSPIHVDGEYAKQSGFPDRVMHGTILNGFLSHFIGTQFPGKSALLMSVDIRFHAPCFLNDELILETTVTQVVEATEVVVIGFEFRNLTRNVVAAKGRTMVKVRKNL